MTRLDWDRVKRQDLERRQGTLVIADEDSTSPYCRCKQCGARVKKTAIDNHISRHHVALPQKSAPAPEGSQIFSVQLPANTVAKIRTVQTWSGRGGSEIIRQIVIDCADLWARQMATSVRVGRGGSTIKSKDKR